MNPARFELGALLGRGGFGEVVRARDTATGDEVAIKRLALRGLSPESAAMLQRFLLSELLNHRQLVHFHVVRLHGAFLTDSHLCIVLELCNGGSLLDHTNRLFQSEGRMSEARARWFFQQIIITMDAFHRRGVYHRDLKLENTLLQFVEGMPRPIIKVCDFGLSKHSTRSEPRTRVGTPQFMAPEIMVGGAAYDGIKVDIWSAGVMLFAMLTGRYPFQVPGGGGAVQMREMLRKMRAQELALPAELALSDGCVSLLRKLLQPEPAERIDMAAICADPWFLTQLPPNALTMNEGYLAREPMCEQSVEELQQLVAAALAIVAADQAQHGQ